MEFPHKVTKGMRGECLPNQTRFAACGGRCLARNAAVWAAHKLSEHVRARFPVRWCRKGQILCQRQ